MDYDLATLIVNALLGSGAILTLRARLDRTDRRVEALREDVDGHEVRIVVVEKAAGVR